MKQTHQTGARSGTRPKVSVLMLTFNHARYIAQAIQSVVEQKTDFDVELLIADDCSRDDTVEIAHGFQRDFPGISIFCAKKNRGMYHNLAQIFYRARGEYVAFLEGDDFWISPQKLEKQIQCLEADRKTALCFHQVKLMEDGAISGDIFPKSSPKHPTFEDLLQENTVPTCSAVFRRKALPLIPSWCAGLKLLDWPLFLLLAKSGRVTFLSEQLAVYRIHSAGDWSQLLPHLKSERMIQVLRCVKQQVGREYAGTINRRISELYEHISWCCEERKAFDDALAASWKATVASSFLNTQTVRGCLRLAVRSRLPMQPVRDSLQPSGPR